MKEKLLRRSTEKVPTYTKLSRAEDGNLSWMENQIITQYF